MSKFSQAEQKIAKAKVKNKKIDLEDLKKNIEEKNNTKIIEKCTR